MENSSVYDVAIKSPLQVAEKLSKQVQNQVLLKREDLQPVFSFKLRGAYSKIKTLFDGSQKIKGVIAASAGNHAQGVALSAKKLGLSAVIVMPNVTPTIKVNAVKNLGAKVILHGDRFDDAFILAQKIANDEGLDFIPPFDDLLVIAGQGTIGFEIFNQLNEINFDKNTSEDLYIFIPVGGGGLLAGITLYLKEKFPQCKIIAVEPEESPTLYESYQAGKIVELKKTGIFADGVSVKKIGKHPFEICKDLIEDCILISNDEMCGAVEDIFNETRNITEPSGALAVAGIRNYVTEKGLKNKTLVAIVSGANLNFDRLRYIAERSKFGAKQELLLAVSIPEKVGSYKEFCRSIANHSITEFNYRYHDKDTAQIFVGIALDENEFADEITKSLKNKGYRVLNLMNNEMAKTHIRHMVGGKNTSIKNERLISFNFPERKGALVNFLEVLQGWNISLFHYRSQGAPYGEVLAGLQVKDTQMDEFRAFLDKLGYYYNFEDDNKACQIFL